MMCLPAGLGIVGPKVIVSASTFDPSLKGAAITLSNGNLDAIKTTSGYQTVYGTQGRNSGRYAFEMIVLANPTPSAILVGIADKTNSASVVTTYLGDNSGSVETLGYNDYQGAIANTGRVFKRMTVGNESGNTSPRYDVGDVVTCDVNFGTNQAQFYKNGVAITRGLIPITSGKTYYPGASLQNSASVRIRTTSLAFLPSGAAAWS